MIRDRRPLVLSRYGGIGNQRYGIGFSGDTQSTWATLKLQVAMTPTAANVLFGYWSHDIGGYNIYCPINGTNSPCQCGEVVQPCNLTTSECGRSPGDLYTRWLQFGAVSPILRPHCSHCDKRIWMYPPEFYAAMRAALLFRRGSVIGLHVGGLNDLDQGYSERSPSTTAEAVRMDLPRIWAAVRAAKAAPAVMLAVESKGGRNRASSTPAGGH